MEQCELNFEKTSSAGTTPHIFTVSEIISSVRGLLEVSYSSVWVVGEVSNFRASPAGHFYFSLKDEKALLKAAFFKGAAGRAKFQIKDGMEIICHGYLSIYERGGDFNLIIDHCEPKGIGALQLAFEQLKEKLFKEGLFDPARKKQLPFLPRKIGIVTSPTGAAIRDIINVLARRFPNIQVLLYPVRVQGEGAAIEIAQAISWMNSRNDIDVMIIGRGGGSLEDLWAFNEEIVARAIFASRIPVVSAVGHEIDFTIADFVADKRAPTPSAAAEIVVPKKDELAKRVKDLHMQLVRALSVFLELKSKFFVQIASHLKPPTARFPDLIMQIDLLRERLQISVGNYMDRLSAGVLQLTKELSHLSPLAILAKGYSVVYKGSKIIKSSRDIGKGDELKIVMHEGEVGAEVRKIVNSQIRKFGN